MTRDLTDLTIEIEGIADHLNMIAYSISGNGLADVEMTDSAVASQLWSIANHLDRINEDIERIDQDEAEAEAVALANGFVIAQTGDGEAVSLTDLV